MSSGWVKIALYMAPGDAYAAWYHEVLEHVGVSTEVLHDWNPSDLSRTHVLVLAGSGSLMGIKVEALATWVENGGILICSGSTWGMEIALGIVPGTAKHCSVGRLTPVQPDRLWPQDSTHARFMGGVTAELSTAVPIVENGHAVAVSRHRFGQGYAIFVGPHIGQTVQQIQMGRSVECDGIGSADGSARLDDGHLRAEDGITLDFEKDRVQLAEGDPFFGYAHADVVKEILIRAVFEAVERSGAIAPVRWMWPNLAPAVATLTLDVQEFEVERVINLQRLLAMFGCPAAWMIASPGYTADVYRVLRAMEHEVGLLFQIEDAHGWQEERLKIQLTNLSRLASWPYMGTVRVENGQWRGWNQFYDACESAGARVSLNKGGRQSGTQGFAFGTCHPFFPTRRDGKESLVYEIPTTIWEPGIVTPENVGADLVTRTASRLGCLQIGMRPESLQDMRSATALRRILTNCKQEHFQFVKPEELYKFERARRQMRIAAKVLGDMHLVQIATENPMPGFGIALTAGSAHARTRSGDMDVQTFERFGTTFVGIHLDLPAKSMTDIEFDLNVTKAQAA